MFEKYRKAEKRERQEVFEKWLSENCHKAVPHEKLRSLTRNKENIIKKILKK
ncbi:MAG: hypothetical protein JSW17_06270 [Candidatus Omnitrophota bacterium]|nr:MAG: hypothetical protein JSW17_06270 [Candidatus Omnitrophota bacterium]